MNIYCVIYDERVCWPMQYSHLVCYAYTHYGVQSFILHTKNYYIMCMQSFKKFYRLPEK